MSKTSKNIKMVVQSDSDNDSVSNNSNDSDMESESEQVIEKKEEPVIEKQKVLEKVKETKETDEKPKKPPAKRKTKKESNNLILDTILASIENEKKLNIELTQIKNSLKEKEKEMEKNADDKNKLITKYFEKTNKNDNKASSSSSSPPKVSSGFAKPMTITKSLHKFLELDENINEKSMIEISSLLTSKLKKEDKKYVITDQILKDLNTSINYIKENINQKALESIDFKDNYILIPNTYLKSLIKLLLDLK